MSYSLRLGKTAPVLLAIVLDAMGFGLVYPVMTAIFSDATHGLFAALNTESLRHFYLGLSFLLYPLGMFFGAPMLGDLSDMLGRKKVLLLCMAGLFLSFLMMGLGAMYAWLEVLLFGRFLGGLMAGAQPIAQAAVGDLSTQANKALNMSVMTLALSIGIIAGPLLGGVLSDPQVFPAFNLSTPFMVAAALCFVDFCYIGLCFGDTKFRKKEFTVHILRPVTLFIEAFKVKGIKRLAFAFGFMQLGFSLYFQLVLVLLNQKYGFTSFELGLFNGVIGLGFVLGLTVLLGVALKMAAVGRVAFVALLVTALIQMASMLVNLDLMWVLALLIGMFDMLAYNAMLTCFSNSASESSQGHIMGISGSIMALTWALSGLSTNLLRFISTESLIFIGGMLILLGSLAMIKSQKA